MWLVLAEALIVALMPLISEHTASSSNDTATTVGQPLEVQEKLQTFFQEYYPTTLEAEATTETVPAEPVVLRSSVLSTFFASSPGRTSEPAPSSSIVNLGRTVIGGVTPKLSDGAIRFDSSPKPVSTMMRWTGGSTTPIIFGGNTIPPPVEKPTANCTESEGLYNNKCYALLQRGPCSSEEWLVEKKGIIQCVRNKCQFPEMPFNGECLPIHVLGGPHYMNCSEGMNVIPLRDGTLECDCNSGFIYDVIRDKCFEPYRQGPCRRGQYFAPIQERTTGLFRRSSEPKAGCIPNPCKQDTRVCYGRNCPSLTRESSCVQLNTVCNRENWFIMVSVITLQVGCFDPNGAHAPRTIGNVPAFACGKGMKRDVTGKCRPTSNPNFS